MYLFERENSKLKGIYNVCLTFNSLYLSFITLSKFVSTMSISMLKESRCSMFAFALVLLVASISSRPQDGAMKKDPAAPPPGALPAPVEQVPQHINEPKVAAGSQHASG